MKKIKKVLLLLVAFSFTLLTFNSQAYAVEYYEFEFTVTDVSNTSDIQFSPSNIFIEIYDFLVDNNISSPYDMSTNGFDIRYDNTFLLITFFDELLNEINYMNYDFSTNQLDDNGEGLVTVGTYTITTDVPITFTQTFWDNIIDAIGDASTALSSAASAGLGLIYDGDGLTTLGSALVIPIGLGLVLGVFYLIIRMLPSVRL